jgi:ribose 5-phosphate isomerase RpiB
MKEVHDIGASASQSGIAVCYIDKGTGLMYQINKYKGIFVK